MQFDEESIFQHLPNIIKVLISDDRPTAKEFIRERLARKRLEEDSANLDEGPLELLAYMGHYTLDALCIHVLCIILRNELTLIWKLTSGRRKGARRATIKKYCPVCFVRLS